MHFTTELMGIYLYFRVCVFFYLFLVLITIDTIKNKSLKNKQGSIFKYIYDKDK